MKEGHTVCILGYSKDKKEIFWVVKTAHSPEAFLIC